MYKNKNLKFGKIDQCAVEKRDKKTIREENCVPRRFTLDTGRAVVLALPNFGYSTFFREIGIEPRFVTFLH